MSVELPPEVLLLIISFIICPPSFESFRFRSKEITNFSLVNHCWRNVFQSELLEHPVITKTESLERYLEVSRTYQIRAKSIRIQHDVGIRILSQLLRYNMNSLKSLYLWRVADLDWKKLSLPNLRELHIQESHFTSAKKLEISLPRLKRLSLIRNYYSESISDVSQVLTSFPLLRHLGIDSITNRDRTSLSELFLPRFIAQVAPQIESLMLGSLGISGLVPWYELQKLRLLSIDVFVEPTEFGRIIRSLPPNVKLECLLYPYHSRLGFIVFSALPYPALDKLHTIIYSTTSFGLQGKVTRAQLARCKEEASDVARRLNCRILWDSSMRDDQHFFSSFYNAVDKLEKGRYKYREGENVLTNFMSISI